MSTRPRPRPRPRPVAAPPSSPGPSSSHTSPPPHTDVGTSGLDDEDALFMRNRTRTAQTWKKLRKISDEKEKSAPHGNYSSEDEGDQTSSPHRKHKRRPKEALPDWTKMKNTIILSSDDDDDLAILQRVENKTPNGRRDNGSTPKRAKRARSRSRSITPPPALPLHALQNAKDTIRQFMGPSARAPSPMMVGDDSTDTIILDPELASIARRIQSQASFPKSQSSFGDAAGSQEGGGPENVTIKVRWKPHPLNTAGKSEVWDFKIKRHAALRPLFDETADLASVTSEHLIVSYDNKRVFPSATPHSLGVWAEAELEACDKRTHEYLRANRQRQRSPSVELTMDKGGRSPTHEHSPSPQPDESEAESAAESASGEDKFRLTLRSGKTKDIVVTVRPTTTCGAIITAFLKKAGLPASAPAVKGKGKGRGKKAVAADGPRLMLDGDKLDPASEIGDADLEDGDQVEVVGL
ncbi:hypothetical protein B0H21DRAFT_820607 [Amylocystis lapponica]|nr:hypothetical protein B0H21DRAFT_820607 [Amylocystis lapponica]